MKKCYYQILDVDRKATTAQIKSSYRKLALKFHPDKNPSQQAKKIFVQLTQAYNTLTDPNERTWYDNNREKILFNKEQMSKDDIEMYTFGFNIWNYFTVKCFEGYDDSEKGFFTTYRDVFQKIKAEEAKAYQGRQDLEQQMRKFEGFGIQTTSIEKVLKFYEDWENFTTYKTFIWTDEYDTRQAQNRYIRREMQKINSKQRQKQKKNYIKTIKDLVSFLKKRDPRYREYLMKMKQEQQKKAQQKIQREKQKKKQKEQMKIVKQKLQQERWKQIEQLKNQQPNEEQDQLNQQDEVSYQFYCPICDKQFKSQNQLKNHEKSKMHKKNVKDLQKQVMSKDQLIEEVKNIQQTNITSQEPQKKKKKNKKKKAKKNENQSEEEEQIKTEANVKLNVEKQESENLKKKQQSQPQDDDDDQDAFISAMLGSQKKKQTPKVQINEQPTKGKKKANKQKPIVQDSESQPQEQQQEKKLGKAKQKKLKKVEQAQKNQNQGHKCKVCSQSFSSKTKLFEHLNKTGHAATKK